MPKRIPAVHCHDGQWGNLKFSGLGRNPLAGDLGADCPVFTDDKISLEVTDFNKVDEEFATICELKQREIVRKLTTRIEV